MAKLKLSRSSLPTTSQSGPAWRTPLILIALLLFCAVSTPSARSQTDREIQALEMEVETLTETGKLPEAAAAAERLLAATERRHGAQSQDAGYALRDLGQLYGRLGESSKADRMIRRALSIFEATERPGHPAITEHRNLLARRLMASQEFEKAEAVLDRAIADWEQTGNAADPMITDVFVTKAEILSHTGRPAQALRYRKLVLAAYEANFPSDNPFIGRAANALGVLYLSLGQLAEAEEQLTRALAVWRKSLRPDHPNIATALHNLAGIKHDKGESIESEALYRQAIEALAKSNPVPERDLGLARLGLAQTLAALDKVGAAEQENKQAISLFEARKPRRDLDIALGYNNLASLYRQQFRNQDALPLLQKSLDLRVAALPSDHPDIIQSRNNLGSLYSALGRHDLAEEHLQRALATAERVYSGDHPTVATLLNNLVSVHEHLGRYADAEATSRRALAMRRATLPPTHPAISNSLNNLAALLRRTDRKPEARTLYQEALSIDDRAGRGDTLSTVTIAHNLAVLSLDDKDLEGAARYWERSTASLKIHLKRGALTNRNADAGASQAERRAYNRQFEGLAQVQRRIAERTPDARPALIDSTFEAAQWALSSAAGGALEQMAARTSHASAQLTSLARERADLAREWQRRDNARTAEYTAADGRNRAEDRSSNAVRLAEIERRIETIDDRLAADFPQFSALLQPGAVSASRVRQLLEPDEALVLFLDLPSSASMPEETLIWLVTRTATRWSTTGMGSAALAREVAALRCGLDERAWDGAGSERCRSLTAATGVGPPSPGDPLPFDAKRAHALYTALFGGAADLIAGRKLLVVPSGPLTQLPLHVLVDKPPTDADPRRLSWLARTHDITVLPAVSSLEALRRVARPSAATRPMIGFGNPLLDGDPGDPDQRKLAAQARASQACASLQSIAASSSRRPSPPAVRSSSMLGKDATLLAALRRQWPLPETAAELCTVARHIGSSPEDVHLGARSSEAAVKTLSANGTLATYRVVHFATHGVLAGELDGTGEPGLILSPPDHATPHDDGYLSASEIASLRLDAVWVILSACNTAGGASAGETETLSGLARAFFLAQARSLLVSHWAVDSAATVKLISLAVEALSNDPKLGQSGALRRAMTAMLEGGSVREAHPSLWAPFVVVGQSTAVQ